MTRGWRAFRHRWSFRAQPLRSRLAVLVAVAVAVAVAAVALSAWLITRQTLTDRLDDSLSASNRGVVAYVNSRLSVQGCLPQEPAGGDPRNPYVPGQSPSIQIIDQEGARCWIAGNTFPADSGDKAVAAGKRVETYHDAIDSTGRAVRVYTRFEPLNGQAVAISVAEPLSQVTDPLERLALILAVVAGIGVLGATTSGLLVAGAGLRPVDRLTDAVEHIARTEDLAVRIPVEGEDEIARLSASFNSMTARLASSRDRQQQLIADAGHELRTPLTSLRTNVELLARSEQTGRPIPPDDRRALMESVKAQMTELASLIGDLQELSRPDALPGTEQVRFVAVHEAAGQAINRARLRGPGLNISADLTPWYVRAEPAALERALVNLLDNAVKFSPAGGTVEVRLRHGDLTVRDHGPGIPEDELPHVFERFWRSPSARSLPGSGLGLAIVAFTVQRSGGTVDLRPAPGGGTLATVRLPGASALPPGLDPDD
ncbi:HAMP domain-containing sensor histidine kinase [Streptomyces sp. SL13]|uniref:histidine kinase n=1 Tax=Streptantibioticus silvisoli TaxID=2705255 RepID=A0AA90KFM1_9ACTN|nr:HAMP domain-containing sensor histidine kinase [Streptantibioticus silvisoli]MDI5963633.1 HAMP domain-containing sensor histidine kinase [Streptantibioticus silvisoli]MDI5969465.1 HAMP domain-containing sensor histidine kinase [Streptantibioticus silvisoli]